jgi:hypothetical protein
VKEAKRYHPNFTLEYHTIFDVFTGFDEGRKLARELANRNGAGNENIVNLVDGRLMLAGRKQTWMSRQPVAR